MSDWARGATRAPVFKVLLGLVISVGLLAWVIWRIDVKEAVSATKTMSLVWMLLAIATKIMVILMKATRWSLLLRKALGRVPASVLRATFIGFFANAVLPAKAGELLRIQVCRRHNEARFSTVLATVVCERLLDMMILVGLIGFLALVFPFPDWLVQGGFVAATAVLAAVGLLLVLPRWRPKLPNWRLFARAEHVGHKLRGALSSLIRGLGAVSSPRFLLALLVMNLGVWLLEALGTYLALVAFDLNLSYLVALFLLVIVSAGVAVPSAPSGLGTHQFLYIICLGWFGVSAELATSISVSVLVFMLLALSLFGIPALLMEGISLGAAMKMQTDEETTSSSDDLAEQSTGSR